MNVVFTYPNADPGHKQVIEFLKKFKNKKDTLLLKMLELIYANLLRNSLLLLGNSSSGIVEAASFKKPVINLGSRQKENIFQKMSLIAILIQKKFLKALIRLKVKNL